MTKTMERPATDVVVRPSTYRTLLVHVEPRDASSHRVAAAAHLARDLDAHLIGLGAETFDPTPYAGVFTGAMGPQWVGLVQEEIARRLADAERAFRREAAGADIAWRSVRDWPHRALAQTAGSADLLVVSPRCGRPAYAAADPGDVAMTAGRPVLLVPEGRGRLTGRAVVVAWKSTREARRALADALPFLQRADEVIVVAVAGADAADAAAIELADVVANLERHGVCARALVTACEDGGVAEALDRVASLNGADLIVAGAYGHSRLQEWAFGGVTRSLLHGSSAFVLLSH